MYGDGFDDLIARADPAGTTEWYGTDLVGSVRRIFDNSGSVVASSDFDAFGNLIAGSLTDRYGYTGREWDAGIGLYFYRARPYDPTTGRFYAEDEMGFDAGDVNLYRYVGNQATTGRDPSGMEDPESRRHLSKALNQNLSSHNPSHQPQNQEKERDLSGLNTMFPEPVKKTAEQVALDKKLDEVRKMISNQIALELSRQNLIANTPKMTAIDPNYERDICDRGGYEKLRYNAFSWIKPGGYDFELMRKADAIHRRNEEFRRDNLTETQRLVEDIAEFVIWTLATEGLGNLARPVLGGALKLSRLENGGARVVNGAKSVEFSQAELSLLRRGGSSADDLLPRPTHKNAHGFTARDVNPTGNINNCADCAFLVDDLLSGVSKTRANPTQTASARSFSTDFTRVEAAIASEIPGAAFSASKSVPELIAELKAAGPGARGILFGAEKGAIEGHYFNVINQCWEIRFLCGQIGGKIDPNKYDLSLRLIRTNK